MSISDVSLSASARANLLALQGTASLLSTTQARLASGKKVNSALDNASSYFQSQGFLNSANDLSNLKDSMATALQTIKAASDAITSISNLVTQLQGVVSSALQTTDNTTRQGLAEQYNSLLSQLDSLANDSSFNGTNLVNSLNSSLKVVFDSSNTTNLTVQGQNLTSAGLGVDSAVGDFAVGQLAQQTTSTLTAAADTTSLSNVVYSGTLSGLSVTGAATTAGLGSGSGAVINSNSQNFTDGATITSIGTLGTNATLSNALSTTTGLGQTGVTETTLTTGATTSTNSSQGTVTITGQFTATGGSSAILDTSGDTGSAYSLTNNSSASGSTATTITVGVGQTVQITTDAGDGTTAQTVKQYTNNTASAITFQLANANDTVSNNSTLSYNSVDSTKTSALSSLQAATYVNSQGTVNTSETLTSHSALTGTNGAKISAAAGATAGADIDAIIAALHTATSNVTGAVSSDDTASAYSLVGNYTLLNKKSLVIQAGASIQLSALATTGNKAGVYDLTNNTSSAITINLTGTLTNTINGSANTTYASNSTTSYTLGSGTVSTTGVTLDAGNTLNGNSVVNALGVENGNSVTTTTTTAAASTATAGTTTQTGITAYDVSNASVTAIGASGVKATVSGTGTTTYSGTNLQVSLSGVQTLTGNSTTVIADAIDTAQSQLTSALNTLRTASESLGNNNTLVQTRQDFTTNLMNTLQTASDNLVLADTNTEGANLQALQAQNQLGIVSLSISGQLSQSIMKLFP